MSTEKRTMLKENEIAVIRAFKADCYVADHGWESPEAAAWTQGFHKDCGLDGKVFAGTMSSLAKKGLITCNNEGDPHDASFSLTDAGRDAARGIA